MITAAEQGQLSDMWHPVASCGILWHPVRQAASDRIAESAVPQKHS